jgi:hypothetical protein
VEELGIIRLVIKPQSPDMVEIAHECIREATAKIINRGVHLLLFDISHPLLKPLGLAKGGK